MPIVSVSLCLVPAYLTNRGVVVPHLWVAVKAIIPLILWTHPSIETVFYLILIFLFLCFLHVSEVGSPAADATSGSGPDRLPPAPGQSAQCSAVRGGPAGRRSHPGRRDMETDKRLKCISTVRTHCTATKTIYLVYVAYFYPELSPCLYRIVCQIDILVGVQGKRLLLCRSVSMNDVELFSSLSKMYTVWGEIHSLSHLTVGYAWG